MKEATSIILQKILQDKPVAYHPDIAKAIGSVQACLFLCQLLYWTGKQRDEDGWIYKSWREFYNETGLSRRSQITAREILKKKGILEEKTGGMPRRCYYRINYDRLLSLLAEYYELKGTTSCIKSHNKEAEIAQQVVSNRTTGEPSEPTTSNTSEPYTENTTENTTYISTYVEVSSEGTPQKENSSEKKSEEKNSPMEKEDRVLKLARRFAGMFNSELKRRTGVEYDDWAKLMRLTKSFARYCLKLEKKENYSEERMMMFCALSIVEAFHRKKFEPEIIFGKPASRRAYLRNLEKEKPTFFKALLAQTKRLWR